MSSARYELPREIRSGDLPAGNESLIVALSSTG